MGALLRKTRIYGDARAPARGPRRHRLLPRLCEAPAARRGLPNSGEEVATRRPGREAGAAPESRARGAGARVPRAVSVGLQPVQDAARGETQAGMSRIVFAFMWLVHFFP